MSSMRVTCNRSLSKAVYTPLQPDNPNSRNLSSGIVLGRFFGFQEIHSSFLKLLPGYVYRDLWKRPVVQAQGNAFTGGFLRSDNNTVIMSADIY